MRKILKIGSISFIILLNVIKVKAAICDPATQPTFRADWGMRGDQCLPSCGAIKGTRSSDFKCEAHNSNVHIPFTKPNPVWVEAGPAYDVPFCCREGKASPNVCDQNKFPAPDWGMKGDKCIESCGKLGGPTAIARTKRCGIRDPNEEEVGVAYDTPFCCRPKSNRQDLKVCDPKTKPFPDWGARAGACLRSCDQLGGIKQIEPCIAKSRNDAGIAYDAAFCCKSASGQSQSGGQ